MSKSLPYIMAFIIVGITGIIIFSVNISERFNDKEIVNSQRFKTNKIINYKGSNIRNLPKSNNAYDRSSEESKKNNATTSELILCQNQTYENYSQTPFVFEGSEAENPSIKKIIRNCQFKNSSKTPILIKSAQNVLIENNTFINIRTNKAGKDVHAISIACNDEKPCLIDTVTIQGNSFSEIGADGIQLGIKASNIQNILIHGNNFSGGEDVGENGIDVKGVLGPIIIKKNKFQRFRPCESETQDCTGGNGAGLVIHEGSKSGQAQNVVVEENEFIDNMIGIVVANSDNHIIRNNMIHDNVELGLEVRNVNTIEIIANRFYANPRSVTVYKDVTNCLYSDNLIEEENFSPNSWGDCQAKF